MPGKIDAQGLFLVGAGSILAYSGITGKSALGSLYAVTSGKSPASGANANPIQGTGNPNAVAVPAGSISGGGSVTGQQIAARAVTYVGHPYVWGGAPGASGAGGWDCSSFVNFILGELFGLHIPGGTYNPASHGPVASAYDSWAGAVTIPRSQAGAGDLCVWATHIGIAISNTQMVSALNPSLGTKVTGIENGGPQGETLTCRRIIALTLSR